VFGSANKRVRRGRRRFASVAHARGELAVQRRPAKVGADAPYALGSVAAVADAGNGSRRVRWPVAPSGSFTCSFHARRARERPRSGRAGAN